MSHTAPETEGSRIVHDTRGDVRWAWGFAAVFATLPFAFLHLFPLDGAIDPRAPDFNPLVIIPAFLALFAAANVVKATWATLHHRKYGSSTLDVDDYVGVLGEPMTGRLTTSRPIAPDAGWKFELKCIETRVSTRNGRRYTDEVLLWQDTHVAAAGAHVSTVGIPFRFSIDRDCLRKKKSGTVSWNVSVHAAEPGLDFLVEFPVRVEATAPLGYRGREEDEEESRPGALRVP